MFHDDGAVDIPTEVLKSRTQSCINKILKNFDACERNCSGGWCLWLLHNGLG